MWPLRYRQRYYLGSMKVEVEGDVTVINEQTTGGVQRPAQLINTAQRRGEGGA